MAVCKMCGKEIDIDDYCEDCLNIKNVKTAKTAFKVFLVFYILCFIVFSGIFSLDLGSFDQGPKPGLDKIDIEGALFFSFELSIIPFLISFYYSRKANLQKLYFLHFLLLVFHLIVLVSL